jgi:hypothetical protein
MCRPASTKWRVLRRGNFFPDSILLFALFVILFNIEHFIFIFWEIKFVKSCRCTTKIGRSFWSKKVRGIKRWTAILSKMAFGQNVENCFRSKWRKNISKILIWYKTPNLDFCCFKLTYQNNNYFERFSIKYKVYPNNEWVIKTNFLQS